MAPWLRVPGIGTVHAYEAVSLLVLLGCVLVGPPWVRRLGGFRHEPVGRAMLVLVLAGFAGARLLFVVSHWSHFVAEPWRLLAVWSGGRHAPGAVAGVLLACGPVLRRYGIAARRFTDAGTPLVGLAIAVSRLGCFLHGCCIGTPCDAPWCLAYPAGTGPHAWHRQLGLVSSGAEWSAAVHPLPLYFAAAALLVSGFTWAVQGRFRDGWVTCLGIVLFGLTAVLLEPFRADHPGRVHWGPLPKLAWVGWGLVAAGVAGLTTVARDSAAPTGFRVRAAVAARRAPRRRRRGPAARSRTPG